MKTKIYETNHSLPKKKKSSAKPKKSIAEIEKEARWLNMSYGQYVSLYGNS